LSERNIAIYGTDHGKSKRDELSVNPDNPWDIKALKLAIKHPPKSSFPRYPQLPVILGTWETQTIQVDYDNASIVEVKYWAKRACDWHNLEGYVILKSSKRHFHLVFDRKVDWSFNMKVLCWIALESGNLNLQKYVLMQGIKQTSTLRVSGKGNKKSPKIVYRYGSQDRQIKKFLDNRNFILDFLGGGSN
jgi:hypothetical protein